MNKIEMKKTKKLFLILFIGILFSCSKDNNNPEPDQNSIVGTWKITSLTSNGIEELQDVLDYSNICYWMEVATQTTITSIEFSGTDCTTEDIGESEPYTINGNIISFTTGDQDSAEILELTSTTLKIQDAYEEDGESYIDIYTYTKQ